MRNLSFTQAIRLALSATLLAACGSTPVTAQDGPVTGNIAHIEPPPPPAKLKVKQRRATGFTDATVGMIVRRGYELILEPRARASVRCADGSLHRLQPGQNNCPCVAPKGGVVRGGSLIPRGRDTAASPFPVVIAPRRTMLLTTRPTIRWSPVAAATPGAPVTYGVSISSEKGLVWRRKVVSRTELEYPADVKELERGVDYVVTVEAGGKSSKEESTPDLGFTIATLEEVKAVEDAAAQLRSQNLPALETQFFIAQLYAERDLSAEAIEKLEGLKGSLNEPAVLRLLGDLYTAVVLPREATVQYEAALALPQGASDLEGQALALAALGRAYLALGKTTEAELRLKKAVEIFRQLGDTVTADQLKYEMRE